MTALQAHRLYGLAVTSDLPLHLDRPTAGPADVHITLGESIRPTDQAPPGQVLVRHEVSPEHHATFTRTVDGGLLLRFARTADVVVAPDGRTVTVQMADGYEPDFGAVLAAGTVLSFLLMVRGHGVLHASAVEVDGRALAFVGCSGMGKSTMAALLCAAGARLVTDDVLRVDVDPQAALATCYLGATELRLRKSASELADQFADRSEHQPGRRVTGDLRDALRLPAATQEGLPLAGIVVPRPHRGGPQVRVQRLVGVAALLELVRYPRVLGVVDPTLQGAQFEQLAALAEVVPVYVVDVPWGPPFSDAIASTVLEEVLGQPAAGSR